jgi:hypothetical protein
MGLFTTPSKLTINWMWCRQIDFELRDFVGIGSVPQFCLPFELAEKLRKHAFENRTTKTSTMVEALEKYLKK